MRIEQGAGNEMRRQWSPEEYGVRSRVTKMIGMLWWVFLYVSYFVDGRLRGKNAFDPPEDQKPRSEMTKMSQALRSSRPIRTDSFQVTDIPNVIMCAAFGDSVLGS